jgi:hypothetical protein
MMTTVNPSFGVEVFADVEVAAAAHRTPIDGAIGLERVADVERQLAAASTALDRRRRLIAADRQSGVTLRTPRQYLHLVIG